MIVSTLLGLSYALAQPAQVPTPGTEITVERVTHIDESAFSDLSLQGQLVRPSGLLSVVVQRPVFQPLIQIRRDFDLEIQESAELLGS